jgi:hypothetical protein
MGISEKEAGRKRPPSSGADCFLDKPRRSRDGLAEA